MAIKENEMNEVEHIVVRFTGDSGDGMQLVGNLFSDSTAFAGNDFATFPDYPSEIRAPQGTVAGVSGFQIHFGHRQIFTSGDLADVLVTMNPAPLKKNLSSVKPGATIIVDVDAFTEKALKRAGYESNPLTDGSLEGFNVVEAPITSATENTVVEMGIEKKMASKFRNVFALGIVFYIFNRDYATADDFFTKKFAKKPQLVEANKKVLRVGANYADTIEVLNSHRINMEAAELTKGRYRNIVGNTATAWGLLAAMERSGRPMYLGSYPITPATSILEELAKWKSLGVKTFQAEDEIAGIVSSIGSSFAGAYAVTTTSGPGLALKSEAIGLAVITELPLVIVDVQRGGPSTGLPTKTEQSDLLQAMWGRNGESPVVVLAANSPSDSFYMAFEAARIAMEHMTPVILLTDGYIGNGSEVFRIPKVADLPKINPPIAKPNDADYKPYARDEKLVRKWAIPGTQGLEHRIGGLEKSDIVGNVSYEALNHQRMTELREQKVLNVANYIPEQQVYGDQEGDLLVVNWGSTYGASHEAVDDLRKEGYKVGMANINYIHPFPKNLESILGKYKNIIVPELNLGQLVKVLKTEFPQFTYNKHNKVQGVPFTKSELEKVFKNLL
jgi:2-oxoglutarate ferredoxin oxidoreductase subunit alpha